jgi:hypothetical protein
MSKFWQVAQMVIFALWYLIGNAASAADINPVGAWKLIQFIMENAETGKTVKPWGENPVGQLIYLPGGHMTAVLTGEGRKIAVAGDKFNEDRARLYMTAMAYAGTYTIVGNKVTHKVDVSVHPSWVGSDQIRYARLENDTLVIDAQTIGDDGANVKMSLTWKRLE